MIGRIPLERFVGQGDQCTVNDRKINMRAGALREQFVQQRIHFELFWYALVNGVVTVDQDLERCVIRKVKCQNWMS